LAKFYQWFTARTIAFTTYVHEPDRRHIFSKLFLMKKRTQLSDIQETVKNSHTHLLKFDSSGNYVVTVLNLLMSRENIPDDIWIVSTQVSKAVHFHHTSCFVKHGAF